MNPSEAGRHTQLRVLQFIPSLGAADGGTTTYMQQLAPTLGGLCQLHVCALGSTDSFVPLTGCSVHAIEQSMWHVGRMRRQWMALLDAVQPDVVHINCCWMPQIACVTQWTRSYVRCHPHVRLVLTPHGMLEPWIMQRHYLTRKWPAIQLYQRRAVAVCDCLVATAVEERAHLLALGWNDRVELVENGIDVGAIQMRQSWGAPRSLLYMSRLHPKKGLELLLQALVRHPALSLTVAGCGEAAYEEELHRCSERLGLSDRVRFVGAVYGDDKWRLLREADAVVLPSYSENYGLIVAEALASGTPVITTTGTPWQSIRQSRCGWWVDADVSSLDEALAQLQQCDAAQMQQMGLRARQLAERDCSIAMKVSSLFNLYLSIQPRS
ncbi:MAG: glycosyltransferase [Bacteroidales bacterium]|nr:glycosyltransferase [Bacteroidales bacterium]